MGFSCKRRAPAFSPGPRPQSPFGYGVAALSLIYNKLVQREKCSNGGIGGGPEFA